MQIFHATTHLTIPCSCSSGSNKVKSDWFGMFMVPNKFVAVLNMSVY